MKRIFFFLLAGVSFISAQNALMEGVNNKPRIIFKDGSSESTVYDAKVALNNDDCSASYQFTQYWNDQFIQKTNIHNLKWFWKDITYIRIDKVLNVVELDTDRKVQETTTDTKSYETVNNNQEYDIAIYFQNLDDATKAAEWINSKIGECGGTVNFVK